jgi:selenocysteine lyase/cysteine desulfurase
MPQTQQRSEWKTEFEFGPEVVFLNHASFGPVTRRGRLAVESLIGRWGNFAEGPDVDEESFRFLAESRRMFARLIDGDANQVAFAPNTSYGLNAVLWGMDLHRGERILIPDVEFPAVVYAVQHIAQSKGLKVEVLPCPQKYLELDTLEHALRRKAAVLAISWVQYFNGYRYDLKPLTELCHRHGCLLLLDAIQGVGGVPISARKTGVDALACGAQKWLFGQTGSGFLYIAPNPIRPINPPYRGWLSVDWGYHFEDLQHSDRPGFIDGRRWETGTYPFFSLRLSHAGLSLLSEVGKTRIWSNIRETLEHIQAGLGDSRYCVERFPRTENHSGIAVIRGPQCRKLHQHLKARRIHTSFREGTIRVSPHFHNTIDDAGRLIEAVKEFETQR